MTPKQEACVADLRERLLRQSETSDSYAFRAFTVTEGGSLVFVWAEVWRPEWEGTMAEVFCTKRYHVAISRGGGMELLNGKSRNGKPRKAHHVKARDLVWQLTS
jgi:hypothetical protein